jgi:carboxymethylenebutenolidase
LIAVCCSIHYATARSASHWMVIMQRYFLSVLVLSLLTLSLSAQEWAKPRLEKSPRHLEWVTVKHGDREVKSFIAFPEVKDKATAVIVIHEIFGLTDWVRGVTDQLAEEGYIAIAPDLLSGMGPDGGGSDKLANDKVRGMIQSLKPAQVTADLTACVEYLKKLPACNGKVVVCGFCWGGGQTFRFANNNADIKASFPFYGGGPTKAEDAANIKAPIYGFFAGNDNRVNSTLPTAEGFFKQYNVKFEQVTYESGGHGFMRAGEDPKGSEGNKKARAEAWKRWKELLKKI